jgi:hypothetical protein
VQPPQLRPIGQADLLEAIEARHQQLGEHAEFTVAQDYSTD